jgi:5'-nucleotidase
LYKERQDMNNNKKVVWIDMDGVLVDFSKQVEIVLNRSPHLKEEYEGRYDHIPGIFRNAPPIEGAIEAVKKLAESGKYDCISLPQHLGEIQ